ncbi:hypothetical protein FBU30_000971 [Linnemannia zychae]|nr:hypothetical protein FBU30_000971 [Linnemannia zychae]
MCLSTSLIEDADQRKQVIEILVKAFTSNEITQDVFADGNNALHLAAFLNLESTLHLLIAHGCDPTIKNGQGLSALDLLFATKADQLDSVYSESKSFNYCSIKDSTEQSSKTISGIEGASDENDSVSTIGRGSSLRSERFSSSESIIPHQLFASCTAPAAAFIIDTAIHTNHKHKASVCCNSSSSTHNTTRFESIHINDSVERDIYSVPQISQLTFDSSTEDPTKSLIFEKNGNFYDHDHSDLGVKSNGDSSDIRQATDGIDASNLYSFQNEHEKQQYTSKQHDVIELDGTNDELHKDLSCFLRIRSNGIIQSNSKTYLISILKNHHAWKPTNLSIEHFQSHNAYETYISSLGLHRSFDNSYNRHAMHKKSVQWNTIKQVREYQSSTSGHPSDNWDEYYTSEPYENAVEDNIAPTVSPYDIVRPVTPARYRRHSISLNLNNSYIDISNPAKTMIPRPLPDIPQSDNEPAKSSLAGYHKITPPPFSFLSKSKATNNTMSKSIASQTDEQTHLLSSHSSSRRISKSILPWNSKHLVSPVNKTSFFNISCHSQPSKLHKYYDGISSESANILGYQETTETSVAPPITDSSLCVPRTLRSLTPLPGTVPKSYNYEILKTSQFTSKAHTAEEILRQNTPFSTSSEVQDHSKSSIMLELTGNTTKYDSMDPLIPYSSWCSSKTTYSSANMKPKIFTHFKSALREKFGVSPLSSRSSSSAPRCLSSSSLGSKLCVNEVDDKSMGLPALAYTVNRNDSFDGVVNNHLSVVNDGKEVSDRALINQQDCMPLFRITNTQDNTIHPDIPHATSLPDELPQPYLTAPISEYNPSIIDYIQNIGTGVRHGEQDNTSLHQSDALSNDHQVFSTSSGKYSSCLSADTSSPAPGWSVSIEKRENPDISESFSCKSSPQSTISKCSQMHRSRDEPIKSSMPYNSNWIKNKEIALALSKMVYPASNSLPDIALANHGCNRSITDQELASYEIPITNTIDELKAKTVGVAKPCALLDLSPQSQSKALAKITDYSPLQQKDIHANYCQDRLTEPVKLSNMTKPHYVLPELSFVTKSPVKMEYVHGITHDTCSTILGSQDDSIKESFLESTLVNIQGISRGLKSQKYNLRQSIIVERYSDTELQSLSQTFPLVETSFHPSDHEQHSSLWMDLTEYESQPRRTTLSSCDSPMNFETGVLYLRLKRICNFSLRLPEEPTMISIRIDTGCEKVDTDYVPLKDIDTVFNQEFCLPVYPGLAITITLHLMQAPHLQPRFQLQSQANTPLLPLHNVESSGEHMPDKQHLITAKIHFSNWSRGSNCGTLSATSAAPLPLIGSRDYNHSSSSEFNSIISPPAHSASSITFAVQVPFLTQLTRDGIYETESPLEILSRHILFDDELCIGRTGIVFNDIRPACTDQIVNIEFQAVNSWVDLNDYSQVRGQLGRISSSILTKDTIQCDATDSGHDDSDSSGDGDELGEEMDKSKGDIAIANIEATVCFIPGPEMDPEDAAFGEPQNLVDCHLGLKYFQWQKQISFCGELYYSSSMFANTRSRKHIESPAKWIEGRFCIIGSMLWQYYPRSPSYSPRVIQKDEQGLEDDEDGKEKRWRCLDLSLVHGIETNQGYFSARARFLDEMDDHSNLYENEEQVSYADNRSEQPKCSSPEHYLVRNGFRLCIASEKEGSVDPQKKKKTMCDMAFYAETAEASQQWVSALLETCRERPPRPYWMV